MEENYSNPKLLGRYTGALGLTIAYGFLLLNSYWGLGFTIVNLLYLTIVSLLYPQIAQKKTTCAYLLFSLILSVIIPFRAQEMGRILTFVTVFLLDCLIISSSPSRANLTIKSLVLTPLLVVWQVFLEVQEVVRLIKRDGLKNRISFPSYITPGQLAAGLAIGIPVLILLTVLLISADPLFARYFQNFMLALGKISFDVTFLSNGFHLGVVFFLFCALLNRKIRIYQEFRFFAVASSLTKELTVTTFLIALLLALFLFVQVQYLFASAQSLADMGVMLSEYTRKGFTELLIVSSICLFLIALVVKNIHVLKAKFYQIISTVFLTEVFLVLLSASRRVYLYQDKHGFTQARLLGVFFSIWLFSVLVIFLIRVITKAQKIPLLLALFMTSLVTLMLMQLTNIDYLIAVVKKPNLGYGIDYPYIARLSSDAWSGWDEALNASSQQSDCISDKAKVAYTLDAKQQSLSYHLEQGSGLGAWTLPDAQALHFLRQHGDQIIRIEREVQECQKSVNQG